MGDTLFGKPYGLTYEDMIKAHHLLTATAKKTPYQLDLEVKDRKPDIVPKVGDKVKIKSREWYKKWKNALGRVLFSGTECVFSEEMDKYCGEEFTVIKINDTLSGKRWILELASHSFVPEMFEEVYPQESSKAVRCAKAFESSGINASALEESVIANSVIPAINSIQGIGIATDWRKFISDNSNATVLHRRVEPDIPGIEKRIEEFRSILELNKEPELQTIKKHRFIKLENL